MSELLRELWAVLVDAKRYGDLLGHLHAWYQVATGAYSASDRWWPHG